MLIDGKYILSKVMILPTPVVGVSGVAVVPAVVFWVAVVPAVAYYEVAAIEAAEAVACLAWEVGVEGGSGQHLDFRHLKNMA